MADSYKKVTGCMEREEALEEARKLYGVAGGVRYDEKDERPCQVGFHGGPFDLEQVFLRFGLPIDVLLFHVTGKGETFNEAVKKAQELGWNPLKKGDKK